jgi:hypothetical protein
MMSRVLDEVRARQAFESTLREMLRFLDELERNIPQTASLPRVVPGILDLLSPSPVEGYLVGIKQVREFLQTGTLPLDFFLTANQPIFRPPRLTFLSEAGDRVFPQSPRIRVRAKGTPRRRVIKKSEVMGLGPYWVAPDYEPGGVISGQRIPGWRRVFLDPSTFEVLP